MADPKTLPTDASVAAFLRAVKDERTRQDCLVIAEIMRAATKANPRIWGKNLIGFGSYHYIYASGREGDWPLIALSPRKRNITVYIMPGFERYDALLAKLGKHSIGKSCLYINRLSDIHLPTLKKLIQTSVKQMIKSHPAAER